MLRVLFQFISLEVSIYFVYSRGTQNQDRMSDLSLISIEKNIVNQLKQEDIFYKETIQYFIKQKRRIELEYK